MFIEKLMVYLTLSASGMNCIYFIIDRPFDTRVSIASVLLACAVILQLLIKIQPKKEEPKK